MEGSQEDPDCGSTLKVAWTDKLYKTSVFHEERGYIDPLWWNYDVLKINTEGSLQYSSQFMENNTQTNNIRATVPHHFDLAPTSNVNQEVP